MQGITIKGTGRYVPEHVITNDDFTKIVDTSDEWIRTRTGMQRRHIVKDEPAWYLGALAAEQALEQAGLEASQIDMILVTTCTSDYMFPSVACLIQNHLGAHNAFGMDISVACAGLAYGFDMARRYLHTGDVKNILLVSAEVLSQIINYEDRGTCILFGDGAGACVVSKSDGMFGSFLHSDAHGLQHAYCKHSRNTTPFFQADEQGVYDQFPVDVYDKLYMNGREVYKFAIKAMPEAITKACAKVGITPAELDLIIPHQANLRIIETAIKNMGLPAELFYVNIQEYGNTSSASIAIGIDECVRSGKLKHGDKLCVVGFGAGLAYGASVFEF